jgi:hypothetical protein
MSLSRIFPTIVPFDITAGNALIDSTTDNAFIAPVGVDLSPYRGKFMELWSGSTLWAQAWISATAPSGEALGSSLFVNNADFATDEPAGTSWTRGTGWTISGGVAVASSVTGTSLSQGSTSPGALYKMVVDLKSRTQGTVVFRVSGSGFGATSTVANGITQYITATSAANIGFTGTSFSGTIDNPFAYQVTMPASTGALLLSTQGGSRGWAYKHASFNPNAALTMRILAKRKVSGNGSYLV